MLLNSNQESQDREKEKPIIRKARKAQKEREKNRIYVSVKNAIGNMRILTKPCPGCNSNKIEKVDNYFKCKNCQTEYYYSKLLGAIKRK